MPRTPRYDAAGETYHVRQHGVDDRRIFGDDVDRETFLRFLSEELGRSDWTCLAYCLMGTHYHLLVRPNKATLSSGFQRLNLRYARSYNDKYERRGHLFESRFRDTLIESLGHRSEVARYIHLNPVRAGLCDAPERYEWSDYGGTVGLYLGDFIVDTAAALEPFGPNVASARENYQTYVAEADRRVRRSQVRTWLERGTGG